MAIQAAGIPRDSSVTTCLFDDSSIIPKFSGIQAFNFKPSPFNSKQILNKPGKSS
jgi:hypothetical protein